MTLNLSVPGHEDLKPRITVFGVGGAGGCVCSPAYYGAACELPCPRRASAADGAVCSGHGSCGASGCSCFGSFAQGFWSGPACGECAEGYAGDARTAQALGPVARCRHAGAAQRAVPAAEAGGVAAARTARAAARRSARRTAPPRTQSARSRPRYRASRLRDRVLHCAAAWRGRVQSRPLQRTGSARWPSRRQAPRRRHPRRCRASSRRRPMTSRIRRYAPPVKHCAATRRQRRRRCRRR